MKHIIRELELRPPGPPKIHLHWNNPQINNQAPMGETHACWTACNVECTECTSGSACELPKGHSGPHYCICGHKY